MSRLEDLEIKLYYVKKKKKSKSMHWKKRCCKLDICLQKTKIKFINSTFCKSKFKIDQRP